MKKNTLWILIGVIVIILLVVVFATQKPANEISEETISEETIPLEEGEEIVQETAINQEKTPIEIAFDNAKEAEITSQKAKDVDAVLRPVLHSVFDSVINDEPVNGVKMTEEFGPMLTYVFNRKLTEAERDTIINKLAEVGVTVEDKTDKSYTVKHGNAMWVITFYLNNDQKSGLEVTF